MILIPNSFWAPSHFPLNAGCKSRSQVLVRSLPVGDPEVSLESSRVDSLPSIGEKTRLSYEVAGKKRKKDVSEKLEVLWDDGFGTQSGKDFFKSAMDFIKPDGGPPRWFCPISCGTPLKDSPLLLYLPGN